MAYMVRFVSPSPLKIAKAMAEKTARMLPAKTIFPYSRARPRVEPAPMALRIGPARLSRQTVRSADNTIARTIAWAAAASAPALSPAPIRREMADETPAPRPLEIPITTMKMGLTNPTAASAVGPRPATHTALTRL
ncbi:MAG: hypothetical protein A4E49_01154 [Methanosaeta sp. PtaU1.Bin112]|nr:MAG: hypothetical protein A4E49_01154 [Methanosaeta sp. PtaU1.Bin112]